ncbi:unnamed protein product [Effrenium voratum]|nr:unnamed protein product [Effrenium voratum]
MEERVCRICFSEEQQQEGQVLISPCKCEGSQKYIHLSCLRKWQRTVQLSGSNHPEEQDAEDRHTVCNVCKGTFELPPQDRAEMMSDLAGVHASDIAPGLLLVTKRNMESAAANIENLAIRAFIEAKAAHFRRAVYILTEVTPGARDGSDVVLGVNLCRALDAPSLECLSCRLTPDQLAAARTRGVEVLWMNGGPVKPRQVSAMAVLRRVQERLVEDVQVLLSAEGAWVAQGSLEAVLALAEEEAALTESEEVAVLAWAGFAQWSRTQLLGEMARGSWGWCPGAVEDVRLAARIGGLWEDLRSGCRLQWAPSNELSREFEQRFAAQPQDTQQVEAVTALVREFEALRRDTEPSIRNGLASNRGRALQSCAHQ